jgi:hypothetical protein
MGPRPAPLVCAEIHAAGSGIRENLSHFAKTIAFGILHDSFQLLLTNMSDGAITNSNIKDVDVFVRKNIFHWTLPVPDGTRVWGLRFI